MEYEESLRNVAIELALKYTGTHRQHEPTNANEVVHTASIFLQFLQGDDDPEAARQAA